MKMRKIRHQNPRISLECGQLRCWKCQRIDCRHFCHSFSEPVTEVSDLPSWEQELEELEDALHPDSSANPDGEHNRQS